MAIYNLGATGLRGWIYIDGNNLGQRGLVTEPSRQLLVTVAEAPASAVVAAISNRVVEPFFSRNCCKVIGLAIGEVEYAEVQTRLQA